MNDVRPREAALYQTSQGVSVSASSTSAAIGRISRSANSRQTSRISRCSGVNPKGSKATSLTAESSQMGPPPGRTLSRRRR
jgi:hypothetical protein